MARVFKQNYTHNGTTKQSGKWYVEYTAAGDIRRRVPGYRDKAATQQLAAELERDAERRRAGLVDAFADYRKKPPTKHIDEWHADLLAKDRTEQHANLVANRVRRTATDCGFQTVLPLAACGSSCA